MAYASGFRGPVPRRGLGGQATDTRRIAFMSAATDAWTRVQVLAGEFDADTFTVRPQYDPRAAEIRAQLVRGDERSTGMLTGLWIDQHEDPKKRWSVYPTAFVKEAAYLSSAPLEKYGTLGIYIGDEGKRLRFLVQDTGAPDYMNTYDPVGDGYNALLALIPSWIESGENLVALRLTGIYQGRTVQPISWRDVVSTTEPLAPGTPGTTTLTAAETGRETDTVLPDWAAEAARESVASGRGTWLPPSEELAWHIPPGCGVPLATQGLAFMSGGDIHPDAETPEAIDCLIRTLELTAERRGTSFEEELARLLQPMVDAAAAEGAPTDRLAAWAGAIREQAATGGAAAPAFTLAGIPLLPALLLIGAGLYVATRKPKR